MHILLRLRKIRPFGAQLWGALVATPLLAFTLAPVTASAAPNELQAKLESREEQLLNWRKGTTLDELARKDPAAIDPDRTVIVAIGVTGGGKSTLANCLIGRQKTRFQSSNRMKSVTDTVDFRDYDFFGSFRTIDSPGLGDTHKPLEEQVQELGRIARLAPHGIAAFLLVVPRGRFTAEHVQTLQQLEELFGSAQLRQHAILVVTSAMEEQQLMTRDELLSEIRSLGPPSHYLRQLVEDLQLRVVPVESKLDPFRQVSRMAVHQAVLGLLKSNGGSRYDCRPLLELVAGEEQAGADREDGGSSSSSSSSMSRLGMMQLGLQGLRSSLSKCRHSIVVVKGQPEEKAHAAVDSDSTVQPTAVNTEDGGRGGAGAGAAAHAAAVLARRYALRIECDLDLNALSLPLQDVLSKESSSSSSSSASLRSNASGGSSSSASSSRVAQTAVAASAASAGASQSGSSSAARKGRGWTGWVQ